MAEGFALRYGADVMTARSAGIAPASLVAPDTIRCMLDKNIDLSGHFTKPLYEFAPADFDLIVNMSGYPVPAAGAPIREWRIRDPIGGSEEVYRKVRDEIENRVMELILELRRGQKSRAGSSPVSS